MNDPMSLDTERPVASKLFGANMLCGFCFIPLAPGGSWNVE